MPVSNWELGASLLEAICFAVLLSTYVLFQSWSKELVAKCEINCTSKEIDFTFLGALNDFSNINI